MAYYSIVMLGLMMNASNTSQRLCLGRLHTLVGIGGELIL